MFLEKSGAIGPVGPAEQATDQRIRRDDAFFSMAVRS